MANKIISFGNIAKKTDESSSEAMIVFKDISTVAKYQATNYLNTSMPEEFRNILIEEGVVEPVLQNTIYQMFKQSYENTITPLAQQINTLLNKLSIYKIDQLINVQAILNSLHNIFTWRPGERILNPEFGSRLYTLLYEGITPETEERIMAEIRHCVSEWEPRVVIIEVRDVSTTDETEDNTIHLEVIFTIPMLSNEQYAYSFSFNRSER